MAKSNTPPPSFRDLGYLQESEAVVLTRRKLQTLRNWRTSGKGPPYTKIGELTLYPIEGLKAWLAANTVQPGQTPTLATGQRRRRTH